ncbi:MAG: methyltransferase domain-containing protein [Terracidiphilus sp.]|nr:methyltransferase domain-containing protein [Terracidiphilus sp.]
MEREDDQNQIVKKQTFEGVEDSSMYRTLAALVDSGKLRPEDSLLIVFGGEFDRMVTSLLGFTNITLSNVSSIVGDSHFDARKIPYPDGSFDHVLAHAGIHHCSRPHQAVCEMYRVALKSVMFFEAQDSWVMRLAVKLRLTVDYELAAVLGHGLQRGGVDDLPIPNYIYRWTRREVEKLVRTLDPAHVPFICISTEWDFTWKRVRDRLQRTVLRLMPPWLMKWICWAFVSLFNLLLSRYGNIFFVRIEKRGVEQPWMKCGVFVPPSDMAVTPFDPGAEVA